jgi:uncharacterized membrane protein
MLFVGTIMRGTLLFLALILMFLGCMLMAYTPKGKEEPDVLQVFFGVVILVSGLGLLSCTAG